MTRRALVALAILATIAAIAVALAPPDTRAPVTRAAILVLGTVAAWLLIRRTALVTRSTPERFEQEIRRPAAAAADVPSLRTIDTTLRMATASAFGVEFMLKPLLRELVEWQLMRNRGIDLTVSPGLAREAMGEPLWRLIHVEDPTREHGAPGVPLGEVQASLGELERI